MVMSRRYAGLMDVCLCRNMICFIITGVIGVTLAIAGGIILGVGFGTLPKDIWDVSNMAKRIAGFVMIGGGVVLLNIAILSIVFYIKRASFDKPQTKPKYIDNTRKWQRGSGGGVEMDELKVVPTEEDYTGGGAQINRGGGEVPLLATPGGDNDSVFKYNTSMKQEPDSSFNSVPLSANRSITSQSETRMELGGGAPPRNRNISPSSSERPTPSPRPPPSSDTSGQPTVKVMSASSSVLTSRVTKTTGSRSVISGSTVSDEPLPSATQVSRPRADKESQPLPIHHHHDNDDDVVAEVISVSVRSGKKKKKSGKSRPPAPSEMYGGLAEGEEPIPPRAVRKGAATPDTVLVSSDIDDDYGPEEELAPPPTHHSNSKNRSHK